MDDEKDQRIELRKKVKMLEQQIVERARNYMLSNQKAKIKAHTINQPGKNQQTQTPILQIFSSPLRTLQSPQDRVDPNEWLSRFSIAIQNSPFMSCGEKPVKIGIKQARKWIQIFIDILNQIVAETNFHSFLLCEKSIDKLERLEKNLLSELQQIIKNQGEITNKEGTSKNEQKFHQMEVMCSFIKEALNQSEQCNYNLRLQIQQLNKQLKDCKERSNQIKNQLDAQISSKELLRNRLDQLQIMKKEYLKAYSKIKLEKQQIELKMIDLVSEIDRLKQKPSNIQLPINKNLKIIAEQNDEDLMDEFIRFTGSQLSLSSIKQLIQYGLMQEKRSSFEKFVKTALVKMELLEHQLFEQQQRAVAKQKNFENDLHNSYRVLFENIKKVIQREKQEREKMFNETITKIINFQKETCRVRDKADKSFTVKQDMMEVKSECQTNTQQILKEKVNQFQVKYQDLKKKYDNLLSKENLNFQVSNLAKCQSDLKKFMEKLVQHSQKQDKRLNQQFFEKISTKVFETLCNLPMDKVGQIYFVPATKQQLEDALQAIFKFSLDFGQMEQQKIKMLRKQGSILINVIQEIMNSNSIGSKGLIQILKTKTVEFEIVGEQLKSLIKKLIEEQNKKSLLNCEG